MAAVDTPRTASLGHATGSRLTQIFVSLAATLREWNENRLTRNALARLSDRELADIGLTRDDIDAVAHGPRR